MPNECNIILLIIHWLFIYLLLIHLILPTLTIMTQPPEQNSEAAAGGVLKKPQISQENTCVGVCFLQSCKPSGLQRYFKKTPTQVFSCEIWEILQSTNFEEHLWTTNSVCRLFHHILTYTINYSTRFSLLEITFSLSRN